MNNYTSIKLPIMMATDRFIGMIAYVDKLSFLHKTTTIDGYTINAHMKINENLYKEIHKMTLNKTHRLISLPDSKRSSELAHGIEYHVYVYDLGYTCVPGILISDENGHPFFLFTDGSADFSKKLPTKVVYHVLPLNNATKSKLKELYPEEEKDAIYSAIASIKGYNIYNVGLGNETKYNMRQYFSEIQKNIGMNIDHQLGEGFINVPLIELDTGANGSVYVTKALNKRGSKLIKDSSTDNVVVLHYGNGIYTRRLEPIEFPNMMCCNGFIHEMVESRGESLDLVDGKLEWSANKAFDSEADVYTMNEGIFRIYNKPVPTAENFRDGISELFRQRNNKISDAGVKEAEMKIAEFIDGHLIESGFVAHQENYNNAANNVAAVIDKLKNKEEIVEVIAEKAKNKVESLKQKRSYAEVLYTLKFIKALGKAIDKEG